MVKAFTAVLDQSLTGRWRADPKMRLSLTMAAGRTGLLLGGE
jgi:hypothetical protein